MSTTPSRRASPARKAHVASFATEVSVSPKTRWKEIADSVQQDIESGAVGVGQLLPSETALTKEWKVSRMTAHRAMQELQRSGLVTRQRGRGTTVAGSNRNATGKIALMFHGPLDRLELEYIRGIDIELSDQFQFLLCDSHGDVRREAEFLQLIQKEADGIICMPSGHGANTPLLQRLVASGYPIVCIDRVPQEVEIDAVVSDNFAVSKQALTSLVERGHRRIAHFTQDQMQLSAVRERHQAFLEVMREAGEAHPERLVRFSPTLTQENFSTNVQITHDAIFALRHHADPPTAIFCLNDYCLTLVLAALEHMGLDIPRDIEILSFHDALTLTPSVAARLTRIVQETCSMGQLTAQILKRRLNEEVGPSQVIYVPAIIYPLQNQKMALSLTNGPPSVLSTALASSPLTATTRTA